MRISLAYLNQERAFNQMKYTGMFSLLTKSPPNNMNGMRIGGATAKATVTDPQRTEITYPKDTATFAVKSNTPTAIKKASHEPYKPIIQ
uniref:Uncharacterized protein n=1 Tax=Arion vulgaris TaxID=1028688 RepID=A0A0B6ZU44_9EUPU